MGGVFRKVKEKVRLNESNFSNSSSSCHKLIHGTKVFKEMSKEVEERFSKET